MTKKKIIRKGLEVLHYENDSKRMGHETGF